MKTKKSNKIRIIEHIEDILCEQLRPDQLNIVVALQKVNGREQGIIDFGGYYITGNYNHDIYDVLEDIEEHLRNED